MSIELLVILPTSMMFTAEPVLMGWFLTVRCSSCSLKGRCAFLAISWGVSSAFDDTRMSTDLPNCRIFEAYGLTVCGDVRGRRARGGTTYGNYFISPDPLSVLESRPNLLEHEAIHAKQWAKWGPPFALMYLEEEKTIRNMNLPAQCNIFEQEAGLSNGGYFPCPGR